MADLRVSQTVVETLDSGLADIRLSQTAVEALDSGLADLRVSQTVVETLDSTLANIRLSQTVIEVLELPALIPGGGGGGFLTGVNPPPGIVPSIAPEVFIVMTLGGVDYGFGVGQFNDAASWFGGEKKGRITDISSIKYQLTKEGGPQAVSFTVTLLDADRTFHDRAGTTSQTKGGFCAVYVVDHDDRIAGLVPKRLGAGYITKWESSDDFTFKITVKDALSIYLAKFDKEPNIPPGRLTILANPGLDPSIDGKCVPLILGKMSDDADSVVQGAVPPMFLGTINLIGLSGTGTNMLVDVYAWGQGTFVNNGITSIWYNDPSTPLVRSMLPPSVFSATGPLLTPFWPGWNAGTGLSTNYIDYNGIRFMMFFIDKSIPQAELVRQGNILVAANIYGTESVGDGTGAMIDSPAYLTTFLLVNYVFSRYGTGAYAAIPGYSHTAVSAWSWIDTTTFDAVETYFQARLAGGYTAGMILGVDGQPGTVFQFLQDMCTGVWMDIGVNLDGQIIASVYNPGAAAVDTFDAVSHIENLSYRVEVNEQRLINRVEHEYSFYYVPPYAPAPTPAAGDPAPSTPIPIYPPYKSGLVVTEDTASQTRTKEIATFKLQNQVVRTRPVGADVSARILAEGLGPTGDGPHEFTLRGGWRLLQNVGLGKNVYVTHPAKLNTGTRDLCRVTTIDIYPMAHRVVLSGDVITHE